MWILENFQFFEVLNLSKRQIGSISPLNKRPVAPSTETSIFRNLKKCCLVWTFSTFLPQDFEINIWNRLEEKFSCCRNKQESILRKYFERF